MLISIKKYALGPYEKAKVMAPALGKKTRYESFNLYLISLRFSLAVGDAI